MGYCVFWQCSAVKTNTLRWLTHSNSLFVSLTRKMTFALGGKGFFFLNDGFILIIPVTWYMSKFGIPKIRWMNNPRNLMYARVSLCLLMLNAFFLKQYIRFLNRDKMNNKCFIVWKLLKHNKLFFINLLFFEILI